MATARGDQPSNRSGTAGKARRGTKRAAGRFQITAHALVGSLLVLAYHTLGETALNDLVE